MPIIAIVLAFLWLSEISRRRAHEHADYFVGPFQQFGFGWTTFSWNGLYRPTNGQVTAPCWKVHYGFGEPVIEVAVSPWGKVEGSSYKPIDDTVDLPENARYRKLQQWFIERREENARR